MKTLMPVTSGLMKTCCFKIYQLLAKRQFFKRFFPFLDFTMRARTWYIYLLIINLMKLCKFRLAGGPMQEVRLSPLIMFSSSLWISSKTPFT